MPFHTSTYTQPSSVNLLSKLYCLIVLGEVGELKAHVFVLLHGGIQVEIFDVNCNVADFFGGGCTVEVKLDGDQTGGLCATVSGEIKYVAASSQSCSVGVVLFGMVAHYDVSVRDISPVIGGDLIFVNEEYCVGTLDLYSHALGKLSHFVAVRLLPQSTVLWVSNKMAIFHQLTGLFVKDGSKEFFQELS